MDRRDFLIGSLMTAPVWVSPAGGQNSYPSRPVTIIVGFAAGGAGDLAARSSSDYVKQARNIPIALEFRPGAGGTLATGQIARAAPDGLTLSLFSASPLIVAPHIQKVPYDPTKDFTYIASFVSISIPLYVKSDSTFQSWDDILHFARAHPRRFRWASAAPRGVGHIATEAAFRSEGVQTTFVPFGGGADAVLALLGGHIDAVVSADYGPHLDAGSVRLLIETGPDKIPGSPQIPTFKDRGYPLAIPAAYGLFGPASLNPAVIAWWEAAIHELTKAPIYRDLVQKLRGVPSFQEHTAFTRTVIDSHRALGLQIDALGLRT